MTGHQLILLNSQYPVMKQHLAIRLPKHSLPLLTLVLSLVFGLGTAYAVGYDWTGSVNDGLDNWAHNVRTFDWAESGSGMADGYVNVVDDDFTFKYQAFLVGLGDPNGNDVDFDGLNDLFEYTIVAEIPERVKSLTDIPGEGTLGVFEILPGSVWYMYHDDDPNADVPSGMGFDDGTLVASGSFALGETSSFLAESDVEGQGSINIEGWVNYVNEAYLTSDDIKLVFDIHFDSNLNIPEGTSATDAFFLGRAGEGNLDPNYFTGADDQLLFKVDASHTFSAIPEPSTVLLLGVGLLGLAGYGRKRMK